MAGLAEFRRDFEVALRAYEAGYQELLWLPPVSVLPLQRLFEVLACAELFHFKVRAQGCTCNQCVASPVQPVSRTSATDCQLYMRWNISTLT